MVGLEEGLFPSQRSLDEEGKIEEERRLCYVGITRARKQLLLTSAEHRRLYGQDMYPTPSRFVSEIPEHLLNEVRSRPTVSQPLYSPKSQEPAAVNGIGVGQRVMHAKFGEGVVINLEGKLSDMLLSSALKHEEVVTLRHGDPLRFFPIFKLSLVQ